MTEAEIQNILFRDYHQSRSNKIIPNVMILGDYEADLFRITKAGYLHEYEIKLTKADYKADFKKTKKHERLKTGVYTEKTFWGERNHVLPNYFWYVAPEGIIESVPEYAGLILIKGRYSETIKQAPKIHKKKLPEEKQIQILNNLAYRYWYDRIGSN